MKQVKDLTKIRLKSDCKSEPSDYEGRTLSEFCGDYDIPLETPINVVNAFLMQEGLQPIDTCQSNYEELIESKLDTYMGNNEKVCFDKQETMKFMTSIVEGYFANNELLNTDLDHLFEINKQLWEVELNGGNN